MKRKLLFLALLGLVALFGSVLSAQAQGHGLGFGMHLGYGPVHYSAGYYSHAFPLYYGHYPYNYGYYPYPHGRYVYSPYYSPPVAAYSFHYGSYYAPIRRSHSRAYGYRSIHSYRRH